ncbi:hypothetical protein BKA64DRAFT_715001 [Cadophora sp. MPI-SDFR-AT-0126]|nr:hypothetical protein BKA64DRAFT_715001 [Leotiomycetes sp. MPI-SDFR-AT-0126]
MYSFKASFCSLLLCASLVLSQAPTNATNPCAPGPAFDVYIKTQDDVDSIIDCVVIETNLVINTNFSLSLPNLVTVEGDVTVVEYITQKEGGIFDRQLEQPDQALVSLSFPRLQTIRRVLLSRSVTLGSLDLPLLSTVREVNLETKNLVTWTGTNTIQAIDTIWLLRHNISKLEFGKLANTSEILLNFRNPSAVYLNGTLRGGKYGARVQLASISDVYVTSDLQNTDNATFYIQGVQNITVNARTLGSLSVSNCSKLEHLSLPYLTRVSNASDVDMGLDLLQSPPNTGRIIIENNEYLQDINFPSLRSVDQELVVLDNPLLTSFGDGFPALESVGNHIKVGGNMTSFHMPKSVVVGNSVWVNSSVDTFDCSQVTQSFPNGTDISCNLYKDRDNYTTIAIPEPPKPKPKLTYAAKIGLGVGLAVFVVLSFGLGCGFCLWRSHRHPDQSGRAATISSKLLRLWAKESFQKKPPSYPLQDLNRRDEPLPSYQPRPSSTATTLAPDGDEVSRPGTGAGTHGSRNLGEAELDSRSVSPVSAVSVVPPTAAPAPAHLTSPEAPSTLPPGYRP